MSLGSLVDAVDRAAPAALERFGVPGLAVGVLHGAERHVATFGIADADTDEPLRPETQFRIASITKPLVATLALRLVEEGSLQLDAPLEGLRLPWEGITLRRLLSHQSGLAGEWPTPLAEYGDGPDALQRLAGDEPVADLVGPGELFAYCNPAYWLTGALVEQATATAFEEVLQRLVLGPLGMTRTGFETAPPVAGGRFEYPRARRASGGLLSTAGDLLAFAEHHLGGPGPLGSASLAEMHAVQVPINDDSSMGLGFGIGRARGATTIEHGGSLPGFRSELVLVPEQELALVLLTSSDRGTAVIEQVLAEVGLRLRLPSERPAPDAELAALAGRYRAALGSELVVTERDGGLDLVEVGTDPFSGALVEEPPVHLRPAGEEGRFVARDGDARGASAEFLRGGSLLRFSWLFAPVGPASARERA